MTCSRVAAAAVLGCILARPAAGQAPCAAPESALARVDHVPVAVRDLDAAMRDFRALGFSFKPGRPHPDGIVNQHVKFRDGTEVELITAAEPRDTLTQYYVSFLRQGEGGAFAAFDGAADAVFRAIRPVEPAARLEPGAYADLVGFPAGHALRYLFFIRLRARPEDLPAQVTHANTAARLYGVWLQGPEPRRERRLLQRLGGRVCGRRVALPGGAAREVRLANTSVYLLPAAPVRRAVAGVTLEVADLGAARRAIGAAAEAVVVGSDARGEWLRVPPRLAHGIWLELLRPGGR